MQERLAAAVGADQEIVLERILLRARADMERPLDMLGTGAASTLKRAGCVKMALEGSELPAIGRAAGLSEARAQAVLENVIASGFVALYPKYEEAVARPEGMSEASLWGVVQPLISSAPGEHGAHGMVWFPAKLVDFLVVQGTIEDGSVGQIEALIKPHLDPEKNKFAYAAADPAHDPQKEARTWVQLAVLAGLIGVGYLSRDSVIALAIIGLFVLFMGLILVKKGLEWMLLRKTLGPKVKDAASAVAAPAGRGGLEPGPERVVPASKVKILNALSLPATEWRVDTIRDEANALGRTPLKILYLWVFAAQMDQRGFETEGWPQVGPVHLLLNATALTMNQLAKGAKRLLIADQEALNKTVAGYEDSAGTRQRPEVFYSASLGIKNVYCGYPIHTLVCNDATWQAAFAKLAARCDLAVVNLSGYDPTHPGLEYEIVHLLAGGPPKRFVFLYGPATDADAVITSVQGLWGKVTKDAAEVPELIFVRVPDSQDVGYGMQFNKALKGLGWMADRYAKGEGEYVPVAGRIVKYLESSAS
jgi:hypothetical protein